MFLLCAVKVPDAVTEMMMAELHHQEACQRINSILKFYTLWRFRYEVWPRMEEGAQQIFKVRFRRHSKSGLQAEASLFVAHLSSFSDPSPQYQLHSALTHPGNALCSHFRPPLGAPEHWQRSGPNQRRPVCESELPVLMYLIIYILGLVTWKQ